jgi:hypothetical protein
MVSQRVFALESNLFEALRLLAKLLVEATLMWWGELGFV